MHLPQVPITCDALVFKSLLTLLGCETVCALLQLECILVSWKAVSQDESDDSLEWPLPSCTFNSVRKDERLCGNVNRHVRR